jgi:endonuclease G
MLVNGSMTALMDASATRLGASESRRIRNLKGEPKRGGDARTRRWRYEQILAETRDPKLAAETLERIINGNDLTDVAYLIRGAICARSVCRVEIRSDDNVVLGYGSGFLVAPGVLMTNNHVINDAALARRSIVWFDYEKDTDGRDKEHVEFSMIDEGQTITVADLDFALVRLAPNDRTGSIPVANYRWLKLSSTPGKTLENEYLTVIQHPAAERKQVCVRENRLLKYEANTVWYQTDTLGGSSGSPVFNQSWQVVALHHMGVPEKDKNGRYRLTDGTWYDPRCDAPVDETRIKWVANEGIRVSAILERLKDQFAGKPLADAVLNAEAPPRGGGLEGMPMGGDGGGGGGTVGGVRYSTANGRVRVLVPVEITMGIAGAGEPAGPQPPQLRGPLDGPPAAPAAARDYSVEEKGNEALTIKTSDYAKRNGFNPQFLGDSAKLKVPLPKPTKNGLAASFTIDGKKTSEIRYWNFSVALHADRKLALFSIGHVDFAQKKKQSGDATWIADSRAKDKQVGREFYKKQGTFESDRTSNPFDQGHLHMQAHATWGESVERANIVGADTFHYPNCAPQFFQYNQGHPDVQAPGDKGTKLWRGLEDFVADRIASAQNKKCVIITGPIFNAPVSKMENGQPKVNLAGKSSPDPTFGGVQIPKMFYKIVCAVKSGELAVSAFVISQEDYIKKIARLKPGANEAFITDFSEALTEAQARVYRVTIPQLERATGLDFGLEGRSQPWFESTRVQEGLIGSWDDLMR